MSVIDSKINAKKGHRYSKLIRPVRMLFPMCILLLFTHCHYTTFQPKEKTSAEKITELGRRYHELGRFSGSILVQEKSFYYQEFFGYANFETQEKFNQHTTFKIGALRQVFEESASLKDAEFSQRKSSDSSDRSDRSHLRDTYCAEAEKRDNSAIGHLYINEGQGLAWTKSPEQALDNTAQNCAFMSSPTNVLMLLNSLPKKVVLSDGFLEDDGFSYSVQKKDRLSIVILSNNRHPVGAEMTNSIRAILKGYAHQLPLLRRQKFVDPVRITDYVGRYEIASNVYMKITFEKGILTAGLGGDKFELTHQGEEQFYLTSKDAAIRFLRNENGLVDRAELYDGFLDGTEIRKVFGM